MSSEGATPPYCSKGDCLNMWKLIIGILLIVASAISLIVSILRTPENLRGFYGIMYVVLALLAVAGGIALIVSSLV